jgi:hypothetical protein
MVRHQLARVHDAAGMKVIDERNVRLEPLITFHGIFDALALDRPLLEVNVCMDCAFGSIIAALLLPCLAGRAVHALPTAPVAAAASADQEAPAREVAQFCWLAAPDPVASLPASFIQQAPSGQEGKVFASYERLQGNQPHYAHAPSFAAKPGAGATHIKQQCKPLLVRGSIECQPCRKPRAVYAAQSFLAVSEEAGMHKCFAAEQLDIACDDDNQYVCGSHLFPSGHKLDEAAYCKHSLTCSSLVESNLYKANSSTLNKASRQLCSVVVQLMQHRALGTEAL